MTTVIEVTHLRKTYGTTVAVADVSLTVHKGEIFGIVGPNGAGKTTAVESIMGLRKPDGGTVRVLDMDPQMEADNLRQRFKNLSGGQKQRLFIALALLNAPEVVFLDELTTGLDPQARRATWEMVRTIRDQGKTVILVTHFMDEAEELADRMAIIDQGRLVALDTPQALIQGLQAGSSVRFSGVKGFDAGMLKNVEGVTAVAQENQHVIVHGNGPLLAHIAVALSQHDITPTDLHIEQANLEDVFLALTGRKIRA